MRERHASITKITRPRISGALSRKRLFTLLDASRKRPVTWISGPGGSGKTTLAASYLDDRKLPCLWYQLDEGDADIATFFYYMGLAAKEAAPRKKKPLPLLTPEYLGGIPVFTKRYFEDLFSRFKPPLVIVLDNYQDVPSSAPFHEMLVHGLDAIPTGISVMVLSRSEPPPHLARLRANDRTAVLGWEEIRFTFEETREVVRARGRERLSNEALQQLHARAQGWAAGLVLLTERVRPGDTESHLSGTHPSEEIFDYFAGEIFRSLDNGTQEFLLKTAFLPKMTLESAERLTGNRHAHRILSALSRKNYFVEKRALADVAYQYHPLFREFLLSRAGEAFTLEDISLLRQRAARLLENAGQTEDAAGLYIQSGEWGEFAGFILKHAPSLIAQGRSITLHDWLRSLPEPVREATPWLLYWEGACRMPFNPAEAASLFEKAFDLFKAEGDPSGLYLSWSGVVDCTFYALENFNEMDRWIEEMGPLQKRFPVFPSAAIETSVAISMFTALALQRPTHPELPLWEERLWALLHNERDINALLLIAQRLIIYYVLIGNGIRAGLVVRHVQGATESAAPSPFAFVTAQYMLAIYYLFFSGSPVECRKAVAAGLKAADDSGVHFYDFNFFSIGAYNGFATGDRADIDRNLRGMAARLVPGCLVDVIHYHSILSCEALMRGDLAQAKAHGDIFMDSVCTSQRVGKSLILRGLNQISYAFVLSAEGSHAEAAAHLRAARLIVDETKSAMLAYKYHITHAYLLFEQGHEQEALLQVSAAFFCGKTNHIYTVDWWVPSIMQRLCMKALEHGIETAYVLELIRRHKLLPGADPLHIEAWPFALKIYTLGRFEIERDGAPLKFRGKVQKKPLELLKALIAFGGSEVGEEQIIDALWPDADGDAAHHSFETALYRLRLLLGIDGAVQLRDGRLTIDPRYCWVDALAAEQLLDTAADGWKNLRQPGRVAEKTEGLIEKAVGLYRGDFLPFDAGQPWTLSERERLRSSILQNISRLALHWEKSGKPDKASDFYEKSLEIDDIDEEIYQRLMICYHRLGQHEKAVDAYHRCRFALSSKLGLRPSPKTEAIYKELPAKAV